MPKIRCAIYDRVSTELSLNETILHIACEVSGFEHGQKVIHGLQESGFHIVLGK